MFKKLPNELLLKVVSHLKFDDKLNLKTTCSKMNGLVTKAVLYEDLDLLEVTYGIKSFNDRCKTGDHIIQNLINDAFEGSFVKVLHLDLNILSYRTLDQLSNLFPNVTRVITEKKRTKIRLSQHIFSIKSTDMPNLLIKWRNSINKFISCYDWNLCLNDLMEHRYPQLTELYLDGVDDVLISHVKNNRISFLNNAPLLSALTMKDAWVNLDVLEALHTGFPLLKSLKLMSPKIELGNDTTLPSPIAPANTVLLLGLLNSVGLYKNTSILDYILKKYTILERLDYRVDPKDYYSETKRDASMDSFDFNDVFDGFFSIKAPSSVLSFSCHSAAEADFFSKLPTSLKTLTLDTNDTDSSMTSLAKSKMEMTSSDRLNYDIVYKRTSKHQSLLECFERLTSLTTLKIALDSSVQAFNLELISRSVTKLYIGLYGNSFGMDWILSMFPSLIQLYINPFEFGIEILPELEVKRWYDDSVRYAKGAQPVKVYSKLRYLSIKISSLGPGFFDFMKTAVPKLDYLNLTIRVPETSWSVSSISYKYDMSNWNLSKCDISFEHPCSIFFVRCNITIQNVSKCILIKVMGNSLELLDQDDSRYWSRIRLEIRLCHTTRLKILSLSILKAGDDIVIDS